MNDASTKRKHDDDRPAPHDAANTGDGKSRGGQLADTLVESSRVQGAFGNATSIPMAPSPIVKRAFIATESPAGSPMKDIETAVPASIKKPFPTNLFGRPSASNLTTWDETEEINVLPVKKPNETAATTMQTANYTRPLPVFGSTSSFGSATTGTPVFGSTTTTSSISFASLASAAAKKNLDQPPEKPKDGNNVGGTATSAEKNPFGSSAFGDAGRSNLQFQSFGRGFGNFENGKSSENSSETAFKESEKDSKTEANDEKAASDKEEKTNTPEALKQVSADSIKKFTFGGALGGRETESISSGDSLKLNSIVKPASFSGTERAFGSTSSVSMSFGATSTSKSTFEELLKSSSTVGERTIKTAKQTDDDDNENDENDDENALNYEVAIEKKVEIPEIEVKTGEEDESNIFYLRCKLFRMDESNNWKERGVGNIRLNYDEATSSARLVMRAEGVLRLILNVRVFQGMPCQIVQEKYVQFACPDESGDKLSRFLVKTSNGASAEKLMNHIRAFSAPEGDRSE